MNLLMIPILIGLLIIAAWHDFNSYRIPNSLVFFGIAIGLLMNFLLPLDEITVGLQLAIAGFAVGFLIFLPLYFLRGMGAGDIKLMAMVGTFVGPIPLLEIGLYVAIVGGILELVIICGKKDLNKSPSHFKFIPSQDQLNISIDVQGSSSTHLIDSKTESKVPYGVAIAAGTMLYLVTSF